MVKTRPPESIAEIASASSCILITSSTFPVSPTQSVDAPIPNVDVDVWSGGVDILIAPPPHSKCRRPHLHCRRRRLRVNFQMYRFSLMQVANKTHVIFPRRLVVIHQGYVSHKLMPSLITRFPIIVSQQSFNAHVYLTCKCRRTVRRVSILHFDVDIWSGGVDILSGAHCTCQRS